MPKVSNGFMIGILFRSMVVMILCFYAAKANANEFEKGEVTTFQRLYGKENKAVRAEIHRIEFESTHYKRTGIKDPNHEVEYDLESHPLSILQNQRNLNSGYQDPRTHSRPIRITYSTEALDSWANETTNAAKISLIKALILPKVAKVWSDILSLAPVSGPLKVSDYYLVDGMYCGDTGLSRVPLEHMTYGVEDTDIILYVSGNPDSMFCGGSTLAAAVVCSIDQFDRPTAGAVNICLNKIYLNSDGTMSEENIQQSVDVVIHEVAHVLGMNSAILRFFWDPDTKSPRTPRPFNVTTVECVDGISRDYYGLPDENTLQLSTDPTSGQRSAYVVTPKVKAVVRNHFNCTDLEGAQLENQPTNPQDCFGSHWDERLYYSETLSGIISPTTVVLSPLTLALFEDSGWYFANYSNSDISPFGHGAGCDFVRKPCLVQDSNGQTSVPEYARGYFCSNIANVGCSPSHHFKAKCPIIDYSYLAEDLAPPPSFQYFSNPKYGGFIQLDYCPVNALQFESKQFGELDCRNAQNTDDFNTVFGEQVGSDSLCFENTIGYALCHKHKCDLETRKLSVYLFDDWFECNHDFQEISPTIGGTFKIICPRLAVACPEFFCPLNCEGRGVCKWNSNRDAKCECFDETDTSESCSKRYDVSIASIRPIQPEISGAQYGSGIKINIWVSISLAIFMWTLL